MKLQRKSVKEKMLGRRTVKLNCATWILLHAYHQELDTTTI